MAGNSGRPVSPEDYHQFCAPGVTYRTDWVKVNPQVVLKVIIFEPPAEKEGLDMVFIPGWISQMTSWQIVLREMTTRYRIYYVETREKISSRVIGRVRYDVHSLGGDIAAVINHYRLKRDAYFLFGSSLGGTTILDCAVDLDEKPACLILVGPNAVIRIPKSAMPVIYLFYPGFYWLLKPAIKWYLKNFRLDVQSDMGQYHKYCAALDAADPWKLKKAAIPLSKYQVWDLLPEIKLPVLIFSASKDVMHEPDNLKKMSEILPNATLIDMETNQGSHSTEMVREIYQYLKIL
ncbi:MAG: alpha/beta hydrolase [FCB group bacterium]|nr:alpha/beta hydrolase [FCB group bacterium]